MEPRPPAPAAPAIPTGEAGSEPPARRWLGGRAWPLWLLVAAVAVALRLTVAGYGSNYDLAAYREVAEIVHRGGNVYAETAKYNYAPAWFYLLGAFRWVAHRFANPALAFGYVVPAFLSLVDLALGAILLRRFGPVAALCFLFHPVSILITGYHRQFGSLALLVGFLSALAFESGREEAGGAWDGGLDGPGKARWAGVGALGASLIAKHALFAFPFWLAVRQRTRRVRLLVLFVPPALFLASFLPYLGGGGARGILDDVFLYKARFEIPLLGSWLPAIVVEDLPLLVSVLSTLAFLGALVAGAWIFERERPTRALLLYTALLVAFAPGAANQYLALVVPFVVVYRNPFTVLFTVVASLHLLIDRYGLHLAALGHWVPAAAVGFPVQVALLLAAVLWVWKRDRILASLHALVATLRERIRLFVGP